MKQGKGKLENHPIVKQFPIIRKPFLLRKNQKYENCKVKTRKQNFGFSRRVYEFDQEEKHVRTQNPHIASFTDGSEIGETKIKGYIPLASSMNASMSMTESRPIRMGKRGISYPKNDEVCRRLVLFG